MKWRDSSVALVLLLAGLTSVAQATSVAPPSIPDLVGISDGVVVGEVVGIEPERVNVKIPVYRKGPEFKGKFAVATFKPTERLLGIPEGETIRIAFIPADEQPTDGLTLPTPVLVEGETRVLYLKRALDSDLLVASSYFSDGPHEGDEKENLQLTRRVCDLLKNPAKSFKSDDPEDRMYTAWALASRYSTPLPVENKLAELSAEESRAIIEGLLLMPDSAARHFCNITASMGNLTGKFDVPISTAAGYNLAGLRDWLREHRDTLILLRYVPATPPAKATAK